MTNVELMNFYFYWKPTTTSHFLLNFIFIPLFQHNQLQPMVKKEAKLLLAEANKFFTLEGGKAPKTRTRTDRKPPQKITLGGPAKKITKRKRGKKTGSTGNKKATPKNATTKKTTPKKATTKKATTKKATTKKATTKKAAPKKTAPVKAATKKVTKKATGKKSTGPKKPITKVPPKKSPKKTSPKKSPKKVSPKKVTPKKSPKKSTKLKRQTTEEEARSFVESDSGRTLTDYVWNSKAWDVDSSKPSD